MPVATLRIWERRYRLTSTVSRPSGGRLYSAADVQRIALLKSLTDNGHAIGAIAGLELQQLRQVAATRPNEVPTPSREPIASPALWQVAVVGAALAHRLQRPGLSRRLGPAFELSVCFADLAQAAEAKSEQRIDALLVQVNGLHNNTLVELQAAAAALGAARTVVLYSYSNESVYDSFHAAGVALLREPQAEPALADWLAGLRSDSLAELAAKAATLGGLAPSGDLSAGGILPRRYDDATLIDFAEKASSVNCECPRHVVELLMQLSQFEVYSSSCEQLNAADAALHAFLQQTSGAARLLFEAALERLADHEGLTLAT